MGMLSKRTRDQYIEDGVRIKIESNIFHEKANVNYYFKHRHEGLAGISAEQTADCAFASVRRLRVWREIANECKYYNIKEL